LTIYDFNLTKTKRTSPKIPEYIRTKIKLKSYAKILMK